MLLVVFNCVCMCSPSVLRCVVHAVHRLDFLCYFVQFSLPPTPFYMLFCRSLFSLFFAGCAALLAVCDWDSSLLQFLFLFFLYKGFFWPALVFCPLWRFFPLGRFFSPGSCGCLNKIVFCFSWSCTGLCCCCCCCLYYWRAHGYLLPIISGIVVACLHMV